MSISLSTTRRSLEGGLMYSSVSARDLHHGLLLQLVSSLTQLVICGFYDADGTSDLDGHRSICLGLKFILAQAWFLGSKTNSLLLITQM